jgi:acetylglutamate kinase
MEKLYVVKIGGNVIDHSEHLYRFLKDFAGLPGAKILVHGGGKIATELSHTLGIEPKMVEGRRVTDVDTLRVVTMVYAGLINKNVVAQLQQSGCNAIGLTGADANLIRANKRPVKEVDYGYAGDIDESSVAVKPLLALLQTGLVPVFSAITHNGNGQLLNTNADTVASAIAIAMSAHYHVSLVYCFEKRGVLKDVHDDSSLIAEIRTSEFAALKTEGTVAGGMIPKLHNAFEAIRKGVTDVYIGHAGELVCLSDRLFGTRLLAG